MKEASFSFFLFFFVFYIHNTLALSLSSLFLLTRPDSWLP